MEREEIVEYKEAKVDDDEEYDEVRNYRHTHFVKPNPFDVQITYASTKEFTGFNNI